MKGYKLLACGSNGSCQLGISNDDDQDSLQLCKFEVDGEIKDTLKLQPVKLAFGGNHTFALFENGHLYSCGDNSNGQCGHTFDIDSVSIFKKVKGEDWIDVSCGWEFSVLVDKYNQIYVCGLGLKGELGLGSEVRKTELVCMNKMWRGIKSVASSVSHTIVETSNGELYGWGSCRKGQLGIITPPEGNDFKQPSILWWPRLLRFDLEDFKDIALGRDYTAFLTNQGIKTFGSIELALDAPRAVALKCMWSSIHYLEDTGKSKKIVSKGNNGHGQLCPSSCIEVSRFDIGSEHGLILTSCNQVFAWGWGEHGNCGSKEQTSQNLDKQVTFDTMNLLYNEGHVVRSINCGCATSWLIIEI